NGSIKTFETEYINWEQFGYDPQNTGHQHADQGPQSAVEKWSFTAGGDIRSDPIVVNGTVYFGSDDGKFYAVYAENGTKRWEFNVGSNIRGGIVYSQGKVIFGSDANNITALNATTGSHVWSYSSPTNVVRGGATLHDGVVYFGSHDDNVHAVNVADGTQNWTAGVNGNIPTAVSYDAGRVFAGASGGSIYGIDATTGSIDWSDEPHADPGARSPTAANGSIFFGIDDTTYHFQEYTQSGSEGWETSTGSPPFVSPAVWHSTVYYAEETGGYFRAYDEGSGSEDWSYNVGANMYSAPAVSNETVYFGADDNNVYALDAPASSGGSLKWSFSTGGNVRSSPAIADGVVYVGSNDNKLYALQANYTADVNTKDATSITDSGATLEGKLVSTNVSTTVDVYFEWRKEGESSWSQTTKITKVDTGNFSTSISGLSADTTYEFRAIGDTGTRVVTAGIKNFTTTLSGLTVETDAAT
ncbi:MAG: PQQ-binding-like beta-propeller repeat protein, partial [Halobacteria archaeon]|nr:PQQ-binding-like beta-propeller repeat protein [Halobacteria archaeon]